MEVLNLPETELKLCIKDNRTMVFDILRRRFVTLTPEEWVRQHFVHFLIKHKGYPASCVGNEISLCLNGSRKRCDTVVYDGFARPVMIVEYKSADVGISRKVFEQIARYNIAMRVQWLVVSNGLQHYCCRVDYDNSTYHFLTDIPTYAEMTAHSS